MKLGILILTLIAMIFSNTGANAQVETKEKKILIAYYSLRNGNTRIIAEQIQSQVGGDIFRIETVDIYPSNYQALVDQAKKELQSGHRPPLKNKVVNLSDYDIIYIGSPNWWNTIAPAVMTFLEAYSFDDKTIVPFITHEGSRMGESEADIKKLCPKSIVLKGLPIRGGEVNNAKPDVIKWLKEIKMTK